MAKQKRGISGLISHITWVNISPKPCKAKLFVNFLHKLYQKYVKQDALKAQTDTISPISSLANTKCIQKSEF